MKETKESKNNVSGKGLKPSSSVLALNEILQKNQANVKQIRKEMQRQKNAFPSSCHPKSAQDQKYKSIVQVQRGISKRYMPSPQEQKENVNVND